MTQQLALIALLVRDYDEALAYYRGILGFELIEDSEMGAGKRWLVVAPPGGGGSRILLAKAKNQAEISRIGDQTGGRVFLFLHTDDFARDYQAYKAKGVTFCEAPRAEPYGQVVVFKDLYGNKWDLVQPKG